MYKLGLYHSCFANFTKIFSPLNHGCFCKDETRTTSGYWWKQKQITSSWSRFMVYKFSSRACSVSSKVMWSPSSSYYHNGFMATVMHGRDNVQLIIHNLRFCMHDLWSWLSKTDTWYVWKEESSKANFLFFKKQTLM